MKDIVGSNVNSPAIELKHSDLEKLGDDNSAYRRACPACKKGILAVRRDPNTFELLENDYCLLCGQQVKYLDIKTLRGQ